MAILESPQVPYSTATPIPYYQTAKYKSKVENNSPLMRNIGAPLAGECEEGDRTRCVIGKLYNYVQQNVNYVADPIGEDLVQTPEQTLLNGGDCEDLAILLASLLTNFSVKTWLVLVPDHMYVMACGISDTTPYEIKYLPMPERIFTIRRNSYTYFSFKDMDNFRLTAQSYSPFSVVTTPDIDEAKNYVNRRPYKSYSNCMAENIRNFDKECLVSTDAPVIVFSSDYDQNIKVSMSKILQRPLHIYQHEDMNCIMLDPAYKGNAVTMGMEMPKYADASKTLIKAW